MDVYKELGRGTTFFVEKLIPGFVWDKEDNDQYIDEYKNGTLPDHAGIECGFEICPYCADVYRTRSSNQLIFKILDTEKESLIEINGYDTFVFDIRPYASTLDDVEEAGYRGYCYKPQKEYGICDYEKYDGCNLYPTIKCLIVDLIESSKKSNLDV